MSSRILLVEDEADLADVVRQYLEIVGFDVVWANSGKAALERLRQPEAGYQLAILDVAMPEMDGFELAHRIVGIDLELPFLFLTARNERADRLYGLRIGADDYISKPFDVDELVLRMRNIIRRSATSEAVRQAVVVRGDVRFNRDTLRLSIRDQADIVLTPREAELLAYLFDHANRILRRDDILFQLWGRNDPFLGRSLDVFISRLRKYLGDSGCIRIDNVYGVGFVFSVKE